jgi:predicted LPLAT superfamily acyltransferase
MKVNALVFTRHSPKFNRVMTAVSPRTLERMIQVERRFPHWFVLRRNQRP